MALIFLAMLQATGSVPSDKMDPAVPQHCQPQSSASDEIVVCARRGDGSSPYRIKQLPPPASAIPKAQAQLAPGVSASVETEGQDVGGFPSNRVMVRLKIKF